MRLGWEYLSQSRLSQLCAGLSFFLGGVGDTGDSFASPIFISSIPTVIEGDSSAGFTSALPNTVLGSGPDVFYRFTPNTVRGMPVRPLGSGERGEHLGMR